VDRVLINNEPLDAVRGLAMCVYARARARVRESTFDRVMKEEASDHYCSGSDGVPSHEIEKRLRVSLRYALGFVGRCPIYCKAVR